MFCFFSLSFQWLLTYAQKISDLGAFGGKVPNHVLVNEYEAGQGIMVSWCVCLCVHACVCVERVDCVLVLLVVHTSACVFSHDNNNTKDFLYGAVP